MATPLETILNRLGGVRRVGKCFKAICPAHVDRTPSLSVKECDDGRVLLHCFAVCDMEAVVAAMGLRPGDLYLAAKAPQKTSRLPGVRMRELKAAAEFEMQILYIVKSDKLSGRTISQADWARAKLALQRISLVRRIL